MIPTKRGPGRPRKNVAPNTPKRATIGPVMTPVGQFSSDLITLLEGIATDPDARPADRTAAARTIMEARGHIGRHQVAPGDELAARPLSDMTRPQLEQELARLRQHFAARSQKITQSFEDLMG
jgi:hypothetical protein